MAASKHTTHTAVDREGALFGLLRQPATYVSLMTYAAMIAASFSTSFFPPPPHPLLRRLHLFPLWATASCYLAIADSLRRGEGSGVSGADVDRIVRAHTAGMFVSSIGLWMGWKARRLGLTYPLMGAAYGAFGLFHHYRRVQLVTDGAPLMRWSDFGEIWADRKERRKQKQAVKAWREKQEELEEGF